MNDLLKEATKRAKDANAVHYLIKSYYSGTGYDVALWNAVTDNDVGRVREILFGQYDGWNLKDLRTAALMKGHTKVYGKTKGELICLLTSNTSSGTNGTSSTSVVS